MRPAEGVLAPRPRDAGGPGSDQQAGAFPALARVGGLGPNEDNSPAGTWQVAFLREIEPRAARPGNMPRRVMRVGPRIVPAVKSPQRPPNAISEDAFVVWHPRRPNVALPTVGRPSSNR